MVETTTRKTVEIEVPNGVDPSKIGGILKSYQNRQVLTKAYNKARREALNALAKAYPKEYKVLFVKFSA